MIGNHPGGNLMNKQYLVNAIVPDGKGGHEPRILQVSPHGHEIIMRSITKNNLMSYQGLTTELFVSFNKSSKYRSIDDEFQIQKQ